MLSKLKDIWNKFKGYRTYLLSSVLFIASGSAAMGWIPKEVIDQNKDNIWGIIIALGSLGLAALRAGVNKNSSPPK